jgi:hypothetical protein
VGYAPRGVPALADLLHPHYFELPPAPELAAPVAYHPVCGPEADRVHANDEMRWGGPLLTPLLEAPARARANFATMYATLCAMRAGETPNLPAPWYVPRPVCLAPPRRVFWSP